MVKILILIYFFSFYLRSFFRVSFCSLHSLLLFSRFLEFIAPLRKIIEKEKWINKGLKSNLDQFPFLVLPYSLLWFVILFDGISSVLIGKHYLEHHLYVYFRLEFVSYLQRVWVCLLQKLRKEWRAMKPRYRYIHIGFTFWNLSY